MTTCAGSISELVILACLLVAMATGLVLAMLALRRRREDNLLWHEIRQARMKRALMTRRMLK